MLPTPMSAVLIGTAKDTSLDTPHCAPGKTPLQVTKGYLYHAQSTNVGSIACAKQTNEDVYALYLAMLTCYVIK